MSTWVKAWNRECACACARANQTWLGPVGTAYLRKTGRNGRGGCGEFALCCGEDDSCVLFVDAPVAGGLRCLYVSHLLMLWPITPHSEHCCGFRVRGPASPFGEMRGPRFRTPAVCAALPVGFVPSPGARPFGACELPLLLAPGSGHVEVVTQQRLRSSGYATAVTHQRSRINGHAAALAQRLHSSGDVVVLVT